MLRAGLVSIVLTLSVGPYGSLLCHTWCGFESPVTSACPHQDASTPFPVITSTVTCAIPAPTPLFVSENVRPSVDKAGTQQIAAVSHLELVALAMSGGHEDTPPPRYALEPLPLRI